MAESREYDVVILGTGPAGLQAAIHAARRKVSVLVMGKETKSSLFHAHIENFCCLFDITGEQILKTGRQQAGGFGAEFLDEDVLHIAPDGQRWAIRTESDLRIVAGALIIATGTQRNRLGVAGEKQLVGKGVSYCVDCDGNFYRHQDVAVIGNESAAVDGALTLTEIAATVHLVCDRLNVTDSLKARLEASSVLVHGGAAAKAIEGDSQVEALVLDSGETIPVSGVFIETGAKGLMELALNLGVQLDDEMKYIGTDKQQATSVPGIFAAGDICGPPWQMAKAVGEGCVAGIAAAKHARKLRG